MRTAKSKLTENKKQTRIQYRKPKITEKKLQISFFLTNTTQTDSLGFLFGNVVHAQSGGNPVDDAFGENSSDSNNCVF